VRDFFWSARKARGLRTDRAEPRACAMQSTMGMTTMNSEYDLHDHSGARWLAPIVMMLVLGLLGLGFMLVYAGLAGQL
jgi:hypothetical protein